VSRAYAHVFDFGVPVQIGGMLVHSGDLLHGDQHGLLTIPAEIASQAPAAAQLQRKQQRRAIDVCRSKRFSVEKLREALKDLI
jgi:regulator of RNase E activity RraA